MKYIGLFIWLCYGTLCCGQKPALDTGVLGKWPVIDQLAITNDGHFYGYIVDDKMHDQRVLFITSDRKNQTQPIRFDVMGNVQFSEDSRWAVFLARGDSLGALNLVTGTLCYFPGVGSFQVSPSRVLPYVVWKNVGGQGGITLFTLGTGNMQKISQATRYMFQPGGGAMALVQQGDTAGAMQVVWLDVGTGQEKVIWTGKSVFMRAMTFDRAGGQLAFIGQGKNGPGIFYYAVGDTEARPWVMNEAPGMPPGATPSEEESLRFNEDGRRLLFTVQMPKEVLPRSPEAISTVDIWNYKDAYLQSEQLANPDLYADKLNPRRWLSCVRVGSGSVVRVQYPGDIPIRQEQFNDYLLMFRPGRTLDSSKGGYGRLSAVSASTGATLRLAEGPNLGLEELSPGGRFVTWFDSDLLQYWCYDLQTGKRTNLSAMVPVPLYDSDAVAIGRRIAAYPVHAWVGGGRALLMYDTYDIWELDPTGVRAAICLTGGAGRRSKTVFGLVNTGVLDAFDAESRPFVEPEGKTWLLAGYNRLTKDNGFWTVREGRGDLKQLVNGPYCYYIPRIGAVGFVEYPQYVQLPLKAKDADTYLVAKMSVEAYPNWYVTKDFVSWQSLTYLHPESAYNWLTAKLVLWPMTDGRMSQGILYRPEDFDSTKKYPLIFDYYEIRSDQLHQYLSPDYSRSRIDISYFVSNGYLVFVPDIYFGPGHNLEGVCNSVLSAARYLSHFSWVDSTRIGLQGHSFGAGETNYLITHSTRFRAACEVAGVCDNVSSYDEIQLRSGSARQEMYEVWSQGSPYGVGVTPWTDPQVYIKNSSVFFVDRVVTPLLMMQGDADAAVPFAQSIELYLALRRAGKKVWFLQYEKEGHALYKTADAQDFTFRMKQFFDYYLKDTAPPKWMTEGVPLYKKGVASGLELDFSGTIP